MVLIDNLSKFGWTVPLKKQSAQIIKESLGKILINSKRQLNSMETDRGKEFRNKIFTDFSHKNKIKNYSRYTFLGAFLQNSSIALSEIFLKGLFFREEMVIGLIDVATITKKYKNSIQSSTKLTLIQAPLKMNEEYAYHNLLDKR